MWAEHLLPNLRYLTVSTHEEKRVPLGFAELSIWPPPQNKQHIWFNRCWEAINLEPRVCSVALGRGEHLLAAGYPSAALLYTEDMGISVGIHMSGRRASLLTHSIPWVWEIYRSAHPEFGSRNYSIGFFVSALIRLAYLRQTFCLQML